MQPLRVEALARAHVQAVQAVCGEDFTLVLTNDGSVYGCGAIEYGQLGLGDPAGVEQVHLGPGGQRLIRSFRRIRALGGEPVAQIFAGFQAAAAVLRDSGSFVIWGKIADRVYLEPTPIMSLPGRVLKVAFGFNHVLALVETASDWRRAIYSWGSNENGCLGLGYGARGAYAVHSPQLIESFSGAQATTCITDIAAGYRTSYALRQDIQTGQAYLYSWGSGLCGALGLGDRLISEAGAGTVDMWEPVCVFDTANRKGIGTASAEAFRVVSGFQHVAMYATAGQDTNPIPKNVP
jgi:alpha-tubulin suppressor-like RCC1 family protein